MSAPRHRQTLVGTLVGTEVGTAMGAGGAEGDGSQGRRARGVRDRLPGNVLRQALEPGRHADGAGLYLLVREGRASWIFQFTMGGRRREMGLGPAGDPRPGQTSGPVSLRAARAAADAARALLARGIDPIEDRDREARAAEAEALAQAAAAAEAATRAVTFGALADAYVRGGEVAGQRVPGIAAGLRNRKHVDQWQMTLGERFCRALRRKPVAEVATADVLAVLQPIWLALPETASRLRGRIERVLDAAAVLHLREGANPARWRGHLAELLPQRHRLARGHHGALPWAEAPAFVAELRGRAGLAARALEFLILTAARSGEVRGTRWAEIDPEAALWTVPGARMKAGRVHRVPLPDRAVEILEEVRPLGDGEGLIFPGAQGRPLSDMTLAAVLRRMGRAGVTVHGFRSTFRDWVFEATAHPADVAEAALAHVTGSAVERAYRRGDALERRRALMADWARYLDPAPGAVVVPIRPPRASP